MIPNKKRNLYGLLAVSLLLLILAVLLCLWMVQAAIDRPTKDVAAKNSEGNGIPVPIVMYHGLIKDPSLQNNFFIHPDTFRQDLDYLQANGYTPVFMDELIAYTKGSGALPLKPIVLTFDDGYYNNYLYAFPILKEKNMKATISILGRYTDAFSQVDENNAAYSHITWTQIKEMRNSGLVEIQNHTYNLHTYNQGRKGAMQNKGESLDAYRWVMVADVGSLQKRISEMTGYTPTTFTYPFGYMGENSDLIARELGFSATLGCEEGLNYITKDPYCLYGLKRVLRPLNSSSEEFFNTFSKFTP
ncbi:MAG: polysaccharide deacetylase family protein [Anaerovorax sp.]